MIYENKKEPFFIVNETKPLEYPLHIHQYIEIVHVVSGKIQMQIGAEKYDISSGQIAMIFPNVIHDYHTLSYPPLEKTQLHIMNCYLDLLPLHKKQLLCKVPKLPVIEPQDIHEDVFYAEKRLFELYPIQDNSSLVSSLFSLYLSHLFPLLDLVDYQEQPPQDISCDIIAYIAGHFNEDISLNSVASEFGIGKYTLSRIFSNILGINFPHYINSLRIDYAKYLLTHTDWTILKIAVECGYHSQQTFNRIFKEQCLCTPKEYRKSPCEYSSFPYIQI